MTFQHLQRSPIQNPRPRATFWRGLTAGWHLKRLIILLYLESGCLADRLDLDNLTGSSMSPLAPPLPEQNNIIALTPKKGALPHDIHPRGSLIVASMHNALQQYLRPALEHYHHNSTDTIEAPVPTVQLGRQLAATEFSHLQEHARVSRPGKGHTGQPQPVQRSQVAIQAEATHRRIQRCAGDSASKADIAEKGSRAQERMLKRAERERHRIFPLSQVALEGIPTSSMQDVRSQERISKRAEREAQRTAELEAEEARKREEEVRRQHAADEAKFLRNKASDASLLQHRKDMIVAAIGMRSHITLSATGQSIDGQLKRGILISSGGTTLINHAYSSIMVLRETLQCALPVEVVFNGEYEMDKQSCQKFETNFHDVKCIDASTVNHHPINQRALSLQRKQLNAKGSKADDEAKKDTAGFLFKVFALCYITSFDEVLMLDADNMPLRNPEALFNSAEYLRSGTLFFPDWWDMTDWVKPAAYTDFGLPYPKEPCLATESGQLLLNRNMHSDVLEWLWFVNSHSEVTYELMYGDKDTFRLAFALAGKSTYFEQVQVPPSCPLDGSQSNAEPVTYLHVGMIQHSPDGKPAFLHRTAEGKVYPFENGYRKAQFLTPPLSSRRASGILGHDFRKMGLEASQVEHDTFASCPHPYLETFSTECGVSLNSGSYPVPLIPVSKLPGLESVLNASYAVYEGLQHTYHTTFVMG